MTRPYTDDYGYNDYKLRPWLISDAEQAFTHIAFNFFALFSIHL